MRICFQKKICPECGREISVLNYNRHLNTHKNGTFQKYQTMNHLQHDGLTCQFCGKVCKSRNSLAQHEIRCTFNNNRIDTTLSGVIAMNQKQPWNKGLTKETDNRIKKLSEKQSKTRAGKQGRQHTDLEKQHLRECAMKNGLGGFNFRRAKFTYNGVKLDSSYELQVAQSLDENFVKWTRPGRFLYHLNGKQHYYTPDFYLPEYDVYLDPKNDFLIENVNPGTGYNDVDKINQVEIENEIRVLILDSKHLSFDSILSLLQLN